MSLIEIELTDPERKLLLNGINQWGGPAALSDELALAMGFADREDFYVQSDRLRAAVKSVSLLDSFDWARVLVMTEFVFASDVFGAGLDWRAVSGIPDDEAVQILRRLQAKFSKAGVGRRRFNPTSNQEYKWQASGATALRIYKHGSSDLETTIAALSKTVDSFSDDLAALQEAIAEFEKLSALPEPEQRIAVLTQCERLEASFKERHGGSRRMFWL